MPQPDRPAPVAAPSETTAASWPRRILALLVDFLACMAVVEVAVAYGVIDGDQRSSWSTGLFVAESALFTALLGGSFGKLMTRLRVVRVDRPAPVGLLGALLRTVLVVLVLPPLVSGSDGRGLHDLAARTRTVAI